MNVTGSKSKLPTDIKQEYSDDAEKIVITAKPAFTINDNGEVTGLANPNAEYRLVDQEVNVVSGSVTAKGEQIKFEVLKKDIDEEKEYSIKVSLAGKEDNNTNTASGEPSTDGSPSNKSVKVDITPPTVLGERLGEIRRSRINTKDLSNRQRWQPS